MEGTLSVTAPVLALALISLVVPAMLVTPELGMACQVPVVEFVAVSTIPVVGALDA